MPLIYCISAFWLMAVLYDLLGDRLSDFLLWRVGIGFAARYYLLTAPEFLALTLPLAILLGLLYSLSLLSKHHELNAIRASGLSVRAVGLPLLFFGILSAAVVFWVNESVVPHTNRQSEQMLQDARIRYAARQAESKPIRTDMKGGELGVRFPTTHRHWRARSFDRSLYLMTDVTITQEQPDGQGDVMEIHARRAQWLDRQWWFFDGVIINFDYIIARKRRMEHFTKLRREDFTETPNQILAEIGKRAPTEMTANEIQEFLDAHQELPRAELARYQTRLMERFAQPFACFIVLLVGLPLGASFNRRGPLMATAAALALLLSFWFLRLLLLMFGDKNMLDPVLAAWLPYTIFGGLGIVLMSQFE